VLDPVEVDRALALDAAWAGRLRAMWLDLAAVAVFGDLRAAHVGALPRLRKQVLDAGERLRAVLADRAWIPRPRERLKNALASALALREALDALERRQRSRRRRGGIPRGARGLARRRARQSGAARK
jgi:hypothetical protein